MGRSKFLLIVLCMIMTVFGTHVAMAQDTFFDDLKGELNPNYWFMGVNPSIGEVVPTADGVELTMYPNNSWNTSLGGEGLRFTCELIGNFDAQYDFELVNWPNRNGIRLGLGIVGLGYPAVVERVSGDLVVIYGNREVYLTHFPNGIRGITDTTDMSGTMRIKRSGNQLTGYFLKNGQWVEMNSSWISYTEPAMVSASVWGHYRTPGITARVTNFKVIAGSISCPVTEVTIDIKPGSDKNPINVNSKGVIPVAVLTTDDFDATTVNPETVTFGPEEALIAHRDGHVEDVDGDGDMDLMLHFYTDLTGISCPDTSAVLEGETYDGMQINGSDVLSTTGCKK